MIDPDAKVFRPTQKYRSLCKTCGTTTKHSAIFETKCKQCGKKIFPQKTITTEVFYE